MNQLPYPECWRTLNRDPAPKLSREAEGRMEGGGGECPPALDSRLNCLSLRRVQRSFFVWNFKRQKMTRVWKVEIAAA